MRSLTSPLVVRLIASIALMHLCGCSPQQGSGMVREPNTQADNETSASTNRGYIRGVVRWEDGTPLPYASVVLTGTNLGAMTHKDGSFAIGGVPTGTARLRVTAMGWRGERIELVDVVEGRTTKVTVDLTSKDLVRMEGVIVTESNCYDIKEKWRAHADFLAATEKQFTCIYDFEEKFLPPTPRPGVAKTDSVLTPNELDVLAATYEQLVLTNLMYHTTAVDFEPEQLIVSLGTATSWGTVPSPEFLTRISTERVQALANGTPRDSTIACSLRLWSWINPDSAFVQVSAVRGEGGCSVHRGAVVVREGTRWRVCPTKGMWQVCV